ncbi:MAG: 60S ribosomal protein L4 [Paramarteilia canceri]
MLDSVPVIESTDGSVSTKRLNLPRVFNTPLRTDLVCRVHDLVMKNTRQPHAVMHKAGALKSAASWGTGRAKARVPRMKVSGTNSSGSGAYANFCRGGHMGHPLTLNRRWGRIVNLKERRIAIRSAIAASSISSLVMARGHAVGSVKNLPLVVSDDVESYTKTKDAVELLKKIGCYDDVLKCIASKRSRAGKGKMRGRKTKMKRGPLLVFKNNNGIVRAFRNIPGVSIMQVTKPNILKLAPGGQFGRLIIWTQSAFESLDEQLSAGDNLLKPIVSNPCLRKVLRSEAVKEMIALPKYTIPRSLTDGSKKINALKSKSVMNNLNKYHKYINRKYGSILNKYSTV